MTCLFYCEGLGPIKNFECRGGKFQLNGQEVWAQVSEDTRGARSKRAVQTLDALPKSQKYSQEAVHNGAAKNHTAVLDTGAQQSMIRMGV